MKMRRMIATGRLAKGSAACLLILLALSGGCRSGARTTVARDGGMAGPSVLAPDPALQRLIDPRPAPTGLSWLGGDVAATRPATGGDSGARSEAGGHGQEGKA